MNEIKQTDLVGILLKIGYIRVRTKEQNTIRQELVMSELNVDKLYIDKISGKSTERPNLIEMIEYVRENDTVIVENISRFARNTKGLLEFIEKLEEKKVNFISKKENIDTTEPSGKFMLTVFGSMAELERSYIFYRQRGGIDVIQMNEEGIKVSIITCNTTGRTRARYPIFGKRSMIDYAEFVS
ncbi:recombinase family protein [Metaclostridioides mangenotii]|uniref:recombinase family protein n=1 Tax=Metaclostridioides mangenotii TaxID=1540 RepID=UPI0028E37BAB|nr:recombinase family protein [Clostridioides mangenotii]